MRQLFLKYHVLHLVLFALFAFVIAFLNFKSLYTQIAAFLCLSITAYSLQYLSTANKLFKFKTSLFTFQFLMLSALFLSVFNSISTHYIALLILLGIFLLISRLNYDQGAQRAYFFIGQLLAICVIIHPIYATYIIAIYLYFLIDTSFRFNQYLNVFLASLSVFLIYASCIYLFDLEHYKNELTSVLSSQNLEFYTFSPLCLVFLGILPSIKAYNKSGIMAKKTSSLLLYFFVVSVVLSFFDITQFFISCTFFALLITNYLVNTKNTLIAELLFSMQLLYVLYLLF